MGPSKIRPYIMDNLTSVDHTSVDHTSVDLTSGIYTVLIHTTVRIAVSLSAATFGRKSLSVAAATAPPLRYYGRKRIAAERAYFGQKKPYGSDQKSILRPKEHISAGIGLTAAILLRP